MYLSIKNTSYNLPPPDNSIEAWMGSGIKKHFRLVPPGNSKVQDRNK